MKQEKHPRETSKRILDLSFFFAGILTAAVIAATFLGYETTGLTVVSSSAWAEVGACGAFYYTKAKAENRLKLTESIVQNLSKIKKFEPDILVQILETIIREA